MFGQHEFRIQDGVPSWDFTAMNSGYSGTGYLLLDGYNSESTIQTPIMTAGFDNVQVHFAYYLNGEGESDAYVRLYQKIGGGDEVLLWAATEHNKDWHYVNLTLSVAVGESFELLWKAEADWNPWSFRHAWVGLDYIEVVDNGGPDICFLPPPTQFADPWDCSTMSADSYFG